jgi:hypothetical protein
LRAVIAIILQAFWCLIQKYLDHLSPIYISASKILSTVDHLPPPWNMSVYEFCMQSLKNLCLPFVSKSYYVATQKILSALVGQYPGALFK